MKKITPDYVDKALEQMESKIHNDIKNNKNQQMNELKFNLETLKTQLGALQRDVQDNDKEYKIAFKELEENDKTFEKK